MRRNGWILAGGIIGVLRGVLGTLSGIATLNAGAQLDGLVPGYSAILVYELLMSVFVLAVSIFALVTGGDPSRSGQIRLGGFAIIIAGGIDAIWALILLRDVAGVGGTAVGTLLALGLIGTLLVIGAGRLGRASAPLADD